MSNLSNQFSAERESALFVSKIPQRWNSIFLDKFTPYLNLEAIYISDFISKRGYKIFPQFLNERIEQYKIEILFLDVEFFQSFGLDLILQISPSVKIVLITFDDILFHEVNYINSFGVDLVLATDPISIYKYLEKSVPAKLCFLENSRKLFDEFNALEKDIDVLFFGDISKGGRKFFLEELKSFGINVTTHAPQNCELSYRELAGLISRSKIVLNLSKTHRIDRFNTFYPVEYYLQLKGRVIEAGLGGAVCISEYAPSIECIFGSEMVPMFHNAKECSTLIQDLLSDNSKRLEMASQFHTFILSGYEELSQSNELMKFIRQLKIRAKSPPKWVPYQYVYWTLKSRILNFPRPIPIWVGDLTSFLFSAKIYPIPYRFLALVQTLLASIPLTLKRLSRSFF